MSEARFQSGSHSSDPTSLGLGLSREDATALLSEIDAFLVRTGTTKTRFGLDTVNDGKFVDGLRAGRRCWHETAFRVREYMGSGDSRAPSASVSLTSHTSSPISICPVETIGRRVAELMRRQDIVLDQMDALPRGSAERDKMGDVTDDIADNCSALIAGAEYLRPASLAGCMVQIIAALADVDTIVSNTLANSDARKQYRGIERRLTGAVSCLSLLAGISTDEIGGGWNYGVGKTDPLQHFGTAPAGIPTSQATPLQVTLEDDAGADPTEPFVTVEQQLLAWAAHYEHTDKLTGILSHQEEIRKKSSLNPGTASGHANRMNKEACARIIALRARTVRELGIKARVVADRCSDWWSSDLSLDSGELLCRSLIEDVLSAAGVAPIPRAEMNEADLWHRLRTGGFRDRAREALDVERAVPVVGEAA